MTEPALLDLSGYSFTGKSAVYDLLPNGPHFKKLGREVEFELIRVRGGIFDLHDALVINWTLPRSSVAMRDFRRTAFYLGGKKGVFDKLFRGGAAYGIHFPGFSNLVEKYLNSLTLASWQSYWPFMDYSDPAYITPLKKLRERLFRSSKHVELARPAPTSFIASTTAFTSGLVHSAVAESGSSYLVTNNGFSPDNPSSAMRFFKHAKSVVVDRDPRDVYLSAKKSALAGVKDAAVGNSVEDFVRRFRALRVFSGNDGDDVKRIYFEELVSHFDETRAGLASFLNVPLDTLSLDKSEGFHPEKSKSNVGMWLNNKNYHAHREALLGIEKNLPEFLVEKRH